MRIFITGVAGFIGYHLAKKFLKHGYEVIGIDNINKYYDTKLKKDRLKNLKIYTKKKNKKFVFYKLDINETDKIKKILKRHKIKIIYHLAAQAGVRFSINNPDQYFYSNIKGFYNILNICRDFKIKHLFFASSSSVYGDSKKLPSKEDSNTDRPISFYAATKKTNEIIAYSYSSIYKIPITALRFFTVYGPYGRPDMSLYIFFKNIINRKYIKIYNHGKHIRDFTYIDDAINIIFKLRNKLPKYKEPYQCFNVVNNKPIKMNYYIQKISKILNINPRIKYLAIQKGDVKKTHGSNKLLRKKIGTIKYTTLENGLKKYYDWFKNYYL